MVAVVIVTCYSRIYLAYHFPFDILLGGVTGALTAGIAIGVCKVIKNKYGIVDRTSSSRFLSLDGVWQIEQHEHIDDFDVNEKLSKSIPVPSCVQMHGYDHIQYLNTRYPFPVMLPHIPYENPCWHYRRTFNLKKQDNERYYINFEGVDSAFYVVGDYKGNKCVQKAVCSA